MKLKFLLRPPLLFFTVVSFASGCVTPRYVTGITSRGGDVKFLYRTGAQTGVIECKAGADGTLSECIDKPVVFH